MLTRNIAMTVCVCSLTLTADAEETHLLESKALSGTGEIELNCPKDAIVKINKLPTKPAKSDERLYRSRMTGPATRVYVITASRTEGGETVVQSATVNMRPTQRWRVIMPAARFKKPDPPAPDPEAPGETSDYSIENKLDLRLATAHKVELQGGKLYLQKKNSELNEHIIGWSWRAKIELGKDPSDATSEAKPVYARGIAEADLVPADEAGLSRVKNLAPGKLVTSINDVLAANTARKVERITVQISLHVERDNATKTLVFPAAVEVSIPPGE